MFSRDLPGFCDAANRPIGREKRRVNRFFDSFMTTGRRRLLSGQPAMTSALLGYSEKTLEDFVREETASGGQANRTSLALDQRVLNEFVNDGNEAGKIEGVAYLIEIEAAIQTQSDKESFFERGVAVNDIRLERSASDILFQGVRGGEADGFSLRR
jgi:hypothetical protein